MAETKGTVSYLKVNNTVAAGGDFALVAVKPTGGSDEIFFIWYAPGEKDTATAPLWLIRSMQVSMLREACALKLTVVVFHDDASSFAKSIEIDAP